MPHVVLRRRFSCEAQAQSRCDAQTEERYAALLRRCGKTRDLTRGRALHSELTKQGFDRRTFLGALLVQMYGQCGCVDDAAACFARISNSSAFTANVLISAYAQNGQVQKARKVFDAMPYRETVSWNAILSAYSRIGDLREAKRLFDAMPFKDVVSYNAMLSAYAHEGHLAEAKLIFDSMRVRNSVTCNALLAAYCSNELLKEAVTMFQAMTRRNNVSWNVMIAGFAQCRHLLQARAIFDKMPSRDEFSWNGMIRNYTSHNGRETCPAPRCEQLVRAKELFDAMPLKSTVAWNSMIQGYAQHGRLKEAHGLIERMPQTDVITWTAIVTAYAQHGHLREASRLFKQMPQKDFVAINAMVSAYAVSGEVEQAKELFDSIDYHNVVSWNAMITAYAQNGHYREAISQFRRMDLDGIRPNKITFVGVLNACSVLPSFIVGNCIFEELLAGSYAMDEGLATALVNFYGKCGRLDIARALFDQVQPPDVILENAMLTAYANNGEAKQTLDLWKSMILEGVLSDEITFIVVLSACSHAGLLRDGHGCFISFLEDFGISPGVDHYISMVDLLSRTGHLHDAEELVNTMPFEPEASAWRSIAAASRNYSDFQRASRVAEKSLHADPMYPADYIIMSRICEEAQG